VSRLQEIKLGVLALLFCEALEELLAIAGHELRGQLYHIHVNVRQHRVADIELVC